MSRTAIASIAGLLGFLLYVIGVVWLADHLPSQHWLVQLCYFALVGVAWVYPAKWLMVWAVRPPA